MKARSTVLKSTVVAGEADINKYQYLNDNLNRQLHWIDKADLRLAFIVPLTLAMLASISAKSPSLSKWDAALWMWIPFSIFFLSLTLVFCICATFPRITGKKKSNVFFRGILEKDIDEYASQVTSIEEEDALIDLAYQVHINAGIAATKFNWIQKALFTLILASIFWAFTIHALWSD